MLIFLSKNTSIKFVILVGALAELDTNRKLCNA